jgi:hypothetical protein
MANVIVNTETTKWGVTHHVMGTARDVKAWCKQLENSSGHRVLCRDVTAKGDKTVTWRVDVDSNCAQESGSTGPGWVACIAIGLGLGFFFGG